jgi:D-alanine-D-alanine ligase
MAQTVITPVAPQATRAVAVTPRRITVLRGGPSAEREVSLKSGRAVAAALTSIGHVVKQADISPTDLSALDADADVIFVALHGTFGEDGQLQRILEQRGLPFCGSGADASALAMDKVASKRRFVEVGIPTPRFDVALPDRWAQAVSEWTPPVVLKPIDQGSSIGCYVATDADAAHRLGQQLLDEHGGFLIEEYIAGRELTVGILGDETLPPIEIRTQRKFYDYAAKYQDDDTDYLFDLDAAPELLDRIRGLSLAAHRSLGCRDFSRVDWMIDAVHDDPYILEVNTIPGFTDHSLLPKAAGRAGIDFAALCDRIVELALARHA